MAPEWLQKGSQSGPGGLLGACWLSVPLICHYFRLQGASMDALGGLLNSYGALLDRSRTPLERSWASLGALLDPPGGVWKAIWGRGKGSPMLLEPTWRTLQKPVFSMNFDDF